MNKTKRAIELIEKHNVKIDMRGIDLTGNFGRPVVLRKAQNEES